MISKLNQHQDKPKYFGVVAEVDREATKVNNAAKLYYMGGRRELERGVKKPFGRKTVKRRKNKRSKRR